MGNSRESSGGAAELLDAVSKMLSRFEGMDALLRADAMRQRSTDAAIYRPLRKLPSRIAAGQYY